MKFTKMHGLGNDYVYVNGFEEKVPNPAESAGQRIYYPGRAAPGRQL